MRKSRLPAGGTNLFQDIKAVSAEAQASGVRLIKLSIGQPSGPALLSARKAAAERIMSEDEKWHEYQDNGCIPIPDFAQRFVAGHVAGLKGDVDYLPIPGIKSMLPVVILACGRRLKVVATHTNPGYPTPAYWVRMLGKGLFEPETNPGNKFLFDPRDLGRNPLGKVGLVMTNCPHNPSGAIATKRWWAELCGYCEKHNIRLWNDAAYGAMNYGSDSCLLSAVAPHFSDLSWAEGFSASKLIGNGTGWRVGAIVGSSDFVGDIRTIKGNLDSGFVAPLAAGALYALEHDKEGINAVVNCYRSRSTLLCNILLGAGMQLALEPRAGFFTLWQTPKFAFGKKVKNAEAFNFAMIKGTGIDKTGITYTGAADPGVVGVHFAPYIRYAVAYSDVAAVADDIKAAFAKAQVS